MFFSGKKIIYLNCYKEDVKGESAGFVRLMQHNGEWCIEIRVRRILWTDGEYEVVLEGEREKLKLGTIMIKNGEGENTWRIRSNDEFVSYRGTAVKAEELYGVLISKNEKEQIAGRVKEIAKQGKNVVKEMCMQEEAVAETAEEKEEAEKKLEEEKKFETEKTVPPPPQKKIQKCTCEYSTDKWTQLQSTYKVIHPFGDERTFISIEPKDFLILQAPYQKLLNNSFLLHGFYNYHHMILGTCSGLLTGEEEAFYLGVPGTYHEREKMVAAMFGFEGFECKGSVEEGKFGYYMRRVEI